MRSLLGALLLVVGTIVASLAAAVNERPWRLVPLDEVALGDPEVVSFQDVYSDGSDQPPAVEEPLDEVAGEATSDLGAVVEELTAGAEELVDEVLGEDAAAPLVAAGEPFTSAALDALRSSGAAAARVRKRPVDEETVTSEDGFEGRILAEAVYVDDVTEALVPAEDSALRLAREAAVRGLLDDSAATEAYLTPDGEGGFSASAELPADASERFDRSSLQPLDDDARVVGLPPMRVLARASAFIDADLAERLTAEGRDSLQVAVPREPFRFEQWPGVVPFGIGVVVMIAGVVFLRTGARQAALASTGVDGEGEHGSPQHQLRAILGSVQVLAGEAAALDLEQLRERINPILIDACGNFVDGREGLRILLGGRDYASVMAPFSTGERRLSRAWSASADGYRDEALVSLEESIEPFEQALDALEERLGAESPKPAEGVDTAPAHEPQDDASEDESTIPDAGEER